MSGPDLTPEQEEHVRRLLAQARHDAPVPDDVAARLDRVLAGLATERDPAADPDHVAPVVDLAAARRRRRNAAALLAGAAAVIVGGFAVGHALDVDDDAASSADSSVAGDRSDSSSDSGSGGGSALSAEPSGSAKAGEPGPASEPLELSSASLASDLRRELPGRSSAQEVAPGATPDPATFPCATTAAVATYGVGRFYPAYYDGVPAVLALRPPEGSSQRADVLDCTTAAELDSAELPAPAP